jgi:4-amino-4-deoxy-L-arabinose transferase-like glycosyltransferase
VDPVAPREAYYWLCAQRLDWAFFDGPTGTAALVRASTSLLGDGAFGLRFAFPLLAVAATIAAFLLGRELFGRLAGLWGAATLNALPFFNESAIHVNPFLPALAGTLAAAWTGVIALERGVRWSLLAGACLAIAVQFHLVALGLLPGLLAIAWMKRRGRHVWLAALPPLVALLPLAMWNAAHDWPILAAGTLRTALTPRWDEIDAGLGEAAALFSVFTFAGAALAIAGLAREARLHSRPRLALLLAAPFALLWLYAVLHGSAGTAALLALFGLLACGLAHVCLGQPILRGIGAALLVLLAISTANHLLETSPSRIAWREVAASVDSLLARAQPAGQPPVFLIAQDPDATAALRYHLSHTSRAEVFLRESQDASNQFAFWPRYDDFSVVQQPSTAAALPEGLVDEGRTENSYIGRNALYLTTEEPIDLPQTITAAFKSVVPFASLNLAGDRKLRVYLCEDYQTMPL